MPIIFSPMSLSLHIFSRSVNRHNVSLLPFQHLFYYSPSLPSPHYFLTVCFLFIERNSELNYAKKTKWQGDSILKGNRASESTKSSGHKEVTRVTRLRSLVCKRREMAIEGIQMQVLSKVAWVKVDWSAFQTVWGVFSALVRMQGVAQGPNNYPYMILIFLLK